MSNWGDDRGEAVRPVAYGGFWRRFGALIIDSIILAIPTGFAIEALGLQIPLLPTGGRASMTPAEAQAFIEAMQPIWLVSFAIQWTYFTLMECSPWQGTIGKKTFGMVVTDEAGNRISYLRANGRFFGKIISGVILLIGYMMAGWTQRKQALHDMLAGCLVVVRNTLPDGPPPQA